MKERLATGLSWLAFCNVAMIVNVPFFIVLCSKCDMFESKSLYYRVTHGYFDLLAKLPGNEFIWLLVSSPAVWLFLYLWTGRLRLLPWIGESNAS